MGHHRNDPATATRPRVAPTPRTQASAPSLDPAPLGDGDESPFDLASEYLSLSRRQRSAEPPLSDVEVARWRQLRAQLEVVLAKDSKDPAPDPNIVVRGALRVPTLRQIEFTDGNRRVCGFLTQVGEGGVFIATDLPFERDTRIRLEIGRNAAGGGEELVTVEGRVCWARLRQHDGLPAGMGLAFDDLDEHQYGSIVDLVEEALFLTLSQGDG